MLLLPLLLVGCAMGIRAGASPTIDTRGRLGAQAYVGGSFGLSGNEHGKETHAWLVGGHGVIGYTQGEGATVAGMGAIDFLALKRTSWRGGLRYGIGTGLQTGRTFGMFGGAAAVLPGIDGDRSDHRGGGVELRAVWLGSAERDHVVEFALGGVYEIYVLHDLKVIP